PGHGDDLSTQYETGYYRAPFQSEMIKVKGEHGVDFSSQFSMSSEMSWPSGWIYTTPREIGGHAPPEKGLNVLFSPAYNAAKLWSMLPKQKVGVSNDFQLQPVKGTSHRVSAVAASDDQRVEYGLLVWNFSNQSTGAKEESIRLATRFKPGTGPLTMRHYVIDEAHSTYTAGWDKQWLEAVETSKVDGDGKIDVTLKKDSLHGFFFSQAPLKAVAKAVAEVEVNQPVRFDGTASTGLPANYRWDFDAADGVDFPVPNGGPPSAAHGYGATPILAHGYAKPGTYTVTLQVSVDGYASDVQTTTTTVVVKADKTAPPAPAGLTANCEVTDREAYLQWDSPVAAAFADVVGYNVYRKDGTAAWRKISAAPLQATAFVDGGLTFGSSYAYRITAVDASGNESKPSKEIAAAPKRSSKKPQSPVAANATIPGGDLVVVTWDNANLAAAARVVGFHVYRRVAGSGEFQRLTPQPTVYKTYYDDVKNAGLAGKYEYAVTALDAFGNESIQSAPCKAVP
ncbi:MAG TPA: PKD domain-containing protein, partial [Pirellulales bacterium]